MTQILDIVALSPTQRGLYAVSNASPGFDPYMVTIPARYTGSTDASRLRQSFEAVVRRHPHLGSMVKSAGLPHPVFVITDGATVAWADHDLRDDPDPSGSAWKWYFAEGTRPLSLSEGPLLRVTALRVAEDEWLILISAHHIVIDGWSIPILCTELVEIYRGNEESLGKPVPLRNYAAWIAKIDEAEARDAWSSALAGLSEPVMLGNGRQITGAPIVGEASIAPSQMQGIIRWAAQHSLTINTLLQLTWARILSTLLGTDDVIFGQTSAGRNPAISNGDQIIGGLVATMPIRVRVDGRSPAEAGQLLQNESARMRNYEFLGMSEITKIGRVGNLFDTLLVFENVPSSDGGMIVELGDGEVLEFSRVDSPSHYPLAVVPIMVDGELIVRVEVSPESGFDAERMAERVTHVLRNLITAEDMADVDVLTVDEHKMRKFHTAKPMAGVDRADEALLASADQFAEELAIIDDFGEERFAQTALIVRRLAAELTARGLGKGDSVAVLLPRDRRILHAPFAIAHCGARIVQLDLESPLERNIGIISEASASALLIDESNTEVVRESTALGLKLQFGALSLDGSVQWSGAEPQESRTPVEPNSSDPLYAVFTSGTTGKPKGVQVRHSALLNHWGHHERHILAPTAKKLNRRLRIGHAWSTGFDAFWQPTIALMSGHTVVIFDDETRKDARRLVGELNRHKVDVFDTTPSMLNRLMDEGLFGFGSNEGTCNLKVLLLGGEEIVSDVWQRLRQVDDLRVINCYGPTETTVEALMAEVGEYTDPTIGYPLDGMRAEVLDHRLRPVPVGGVGELFLTGSQVADGYIGKPELTYAVFVASDHGRRYRTGDLVRVNSNGTVSFEGRADQQVKINGYRVEPAEAGAVIRAIEGVQRGEPFVFYTRGRPRLAALYTGDIEQRDLRSRVADQLPSYLVPSILVQVDEIPLDQNGKLNLKAATMLIQENRLNLNNHPEGDAECAVSACLTEILGSPPDMEDSLLDIGVDSVGVMDLVTRLRHRSYRIGIREALEAVSLRDLSGILTLVSNEAGDGVPRAKIPLDPLPYGAVKYGGYQTTSHSAAFILPKDIKVDEVENRIRRLARTHPTLRSKLEKDGEEPYLQVLDELKMPPLRIVAEGEPTTNLVHESIAKLDPDNGVMLVAAVVLDEQPELLITVNHLAVDLTSWLLIADDFRAMDRGLEPIPETPVDPLPYVSLEISGKPLGSRSTVNGENQGIPASYLASDISSEVTDQLLSFCRERDSTVEQVLILVTAAAASATADENGHIAVTHTVGSLEAVEHRRVAWCTELKTLKFDREQVDSLNAGKSIDPSRVSVVACEGVIGQCSVNYLGKHDRIQDREPWQLLPGDEYKKRYVHSGYDDLGLTFAVEVLADIHADSGKSTLNVLWKFNQNVLSQLEMESFRDRWMAAFTALQSDFVAGSLIHKPQE